MFYAILWIFAGAILGCLASIVMRLNSHRRELIDILAGSVGALSAGAFWTFGTDLLRQPGMTDISLIISCMGAVILLVLVNAMQRRLPF